VELDPVQKRLVVIKLLHYKNELINEKKTTAFKKLASRSRPEPTDPNGCNPRMGQLEQNQQERPRNDPPRQQPQQQQNSLYRPRSQQRGQQRNWEDEEPTETWQEYPRE
jgi:hypothetical protein